VPRDEPQLHQRYRGGFGTRRDAAAASGDAQQRASNSISLLKLAELLREAKNVIIVPATAWRWHSTAHGE